MVKKKPNPNLLYINLADQMDDKDLVRVRFYLQNNPMSPARLREALFPEICHCLEKQRKIKPGQLDFDFLREMFEDLNLQSLKETVEEFVRGNTGEGTGEDLSKRTALMESVRKERSLVEDYVLHLISQHNKGKKVPPRFMQLLNSFEDVARNVSREWTTLARKQDAEWNEIRCPTSPCLSDWLGWERMAKRQREEIKQLKDRQILEIKRLVNQDINGPANGHGDEPGMAEELANRNDTSPGGSL